MERDFASIEEAIDEINVMVSRLYSLRHADGIRNHARGNCLETALRELKRLDGSLIT